jgi:YbbR domain-containing protein
MSTQFYRGTRKSTGAQSFLHDTDSPLAFFEEMNNASPLILGDWTVDRLDYKGDVLETDIDWSEVRIETTAGRLFGAPKP